MKPLALKQKKKKKNTTRSFEIIHFLLFFGSHKKKLSPVLSSLITLFFKCKQYTYFYFKMKTLIDFQLKLFATTYDTKELSVFLSVNKISDTSKTLKYFLPLQCTILLKCCYFIGQ